MGAARGGGAPLHRPRACAATSAVAGAHGRRPARRACQPHWAGRGGVVCGRGVPACTLAARTHAPAPPTTTLPSMTLLVAALARCEEGRVAGWRDGRRARARGRAWGAKARSHLPTRGA